MKDPRESDGMERRTMRWSNARRAARAERAPSHPGSRRRRPLTLVLLAAAAIFMALVMHFAGVRAADDAGAAPAAAADTTPLPGSEDCAACHEPGTARGRRGPDNPPAFNAAALRASPHAGVDCRACHADLEGADFPHAAKLQPVDCGTCHDAEAAQYRESLHGVAAAQRMPYAPRCTDCHGAHDILRVSDPASPAFTYNVPELCVRCHREGSPVQEMYHIPQDSILAHYSESIHGEGLYQKGLLTTAVCTSCHTAHHQLPHTDPRSSIAHANVAKTCTRCHVRIEAVHRKVVRGELWEKQPDVIPACVDCHAPHKARRVFYTQGMADQDCLSCHAKRDLTGHDAEGRVVPMYVDVDSLAHSRHARISCAQCHTGGNPADVRPCTTIVSKVDCSVCHAEVVNTYRESRHGVLAASGSPDAPLCAECHGTHGTKGKTDTSSPIYSQNIPQLCGGCHRTGEKAAVRYEGSQTQIVESYIESIHGKGLLESGLTVTATCVDCHTAHGERPAADPASTVHPANLAQTCARCHRGIYDLFTASIHSPTVSKSKKELPTCSSCHSAHTIERTDREDFRLSIMNQCGKCHLELAERYFETYHGKVSNLGYGKTAKCDDCHGAHDILPTWDPRSHLSRENIVETCGSCHPGSNRRFAGYLTHATHHDQHRYPYLFYTFWAMTGLLVVTFAVAGVHTFAWLPRSIRYRKELLAEEASHAGGAQLYVRRFPTLYRNLHLMVITSFIGLAVTGMTVKFSYTQWAWALSRFLGGFEAAGFIHRVCAIITFAYFGIHVWDLLRRKRASGIGWKEFITGPSGMMFTARDGREFVQSFKWFLGRGERPAYSRWTYWEKFDYFAVFWGVTVIGTTGLMLWFPTFFTRFIPGWLLNVATIIHSDEALLAVGFIFTVHFFNTHFRPEKFPMDTVIFTGGVPLEEFRKDRPDEYAELVASGKLEDRLMQAPSQRSVHGWRVLGFTALSIGIALIGAILFAAIFAYR